MFLNIFLNFSDAVLRVAYDYAIKPNDKGVEYIESGPKTITCNFTTLKVDVNQELLESIANGNFKFLLTAILWPNSSGKR